MLFSGEARATCTEAQNEGEQPDEYGASDDPPEQLPLAARGPVGGLQTRIQGLVTERPCERNFLEQNDAELSKLMKPNTADTNMHVPGQPHCLCL